MIIILVFFALKVNGRQDRNVYLSLKEANSLYKSNFMTSDGRIMDPDKKNISTSEGQSYIMLQSLVLDDKETFDLAFSWAKNNLQRKDKLFAWLWGKSPQGKYEILDYNSASDADVDIAFALLLAHEKWKQTEYLTEALHIINSIWNNETKRIGNHLVLMPGVEQMSDSKIEVNPSYFSPYAFKLFHEYDENHDWTVLVDSSYYYLNLVMSETTTGLPPNWFVVTDGKVIFEKTPRGDFSYDAVRVFPRIYMDYLKTGDKRADSVLEKSRFFVTKWMESGKFYTNYKSDGELSDENQYIGSIAILLPIINLYDSKVAKQIYEQKLEQKIKSKEYWTVKNDYYGKNLTWFGIFFYKKN